MSRQKVADKNILEDLAITVVAAETFHKYYYKARKELEGIYPSTPRKGLSEARKAELSNRLQKTRMRGLIN